MISADLSVPKLLTDIENLKNDNHCLQQENRNFLNERDLLISFQNDAEQKLIVANDKVWYS